MQLLEMERIEIRNAIDKKFNNNFKDYLMKARRKYNEDIHEAAIKFLIRTFKDWKYIQTDWNEKIPNVYNYIAMYDDTFPVPEEGIVTLKISLCDDKEIKNIFYFSCGNIHKLSVEFADGEIEDGLEEFYF